MDKSNFQVPVTINKPIEFTGERYIPSVTGNIRAEHIHRYLFALQYAEGRDVLDVACGEGYGSFVLGQVARSVIGVDIASDIIDRANESYGSTSVKFIAADAVRLPLMDHSVDIVVCFETIEHLAHPEKLLEEIHRVLRKDGLAIISTPDAAADDGAWHSGNPFHVHEMTHEEFRSALTNVFSNVSFASQRALHGSVIIAAETQSTAEKSEIYHTRDGGTFERSEMPTGGSYMIALASNTRIALPGASVLSNEYEQQKLEGEFRYAVSALHALEERRQTSGDPAEELASLREQIDVLLDALQESTTPVLSTSLQDSKLKEIYEFVHSHDIARKLAQTQAEHLKRRIRAMRADARAE